MTTRRPRLLPTVLAASALVVATAGGVLAATGSSQHPAVDACAPGQEWVTVQPVFDPADVEETAGPMLAGCLDTTRPTPSDPAPTNPLG